MTRTAATAHHVSEIKACHGNEFEKKLPDELSASIHPGCCSCIRAPEMFPEKKTRLPVGHLLTDKDFQGMLLVTRHKDILATRMASGQRPPSSLQQRELFV